jgi:hypothetical protein
MRNKQQAAHRNTFEKHLYIAIDRDDVDQIYIQHVRVYRACARILIIMLFIKWSMHNYVYGRADAIAAHHQSCTCSRSRASKLDDQSTVMITVIAMGAQAWKRGSKNQTGSEKSPHTRRQEMRSGNGLSP